MCRAANARTLHAAHPTEAEVVQLEVNEAGITGLFQKLEDGPFDLPTLRSHRDGIPRLHQQSLKEIRHPPTPVTGILDSHQDIVCRDNGSLWHSPDAERHTATVIPHD